MPCTKTRKWQACVATSLCMGVTLVVLGIVMPFVINHVIKKQVLQQTLMGPDNVDFWGQVPGRTGVIILRNFTFFDWLNAKDVMFKNATPKFVEVGPYSYQELQNFTEPVFNEDKSLVDYKFYVHTRPLLQQDSTRKIRFANFVALGAWFQMNHVEDALMTLQTFGQLIYGMETLIIPNVYGQAIATLYYNTYAKARATILKELTEEQAYFAYYDHYQGVGNATAFVAWVNAATNGYSSGSSDYIRNYFDISYAQMMNIIDEVNSKITGVGSLLNSYYCKGPCTPAYLTALQWSQQGVTYKPPDVGIPPQPSVITGNSTAFGYPELSYFYQEYFLVNVSNETIYQNLTFEREWAQKILNHSAYTPENPVFYSDPWLILNIGNMRSLYKFGKAYDQNKNETNLENIRDQFLLNTTAQARVFWEYFKYIGSEFGVQPQNNGTSATTSMGGVISQTLFQEFSNLENQFFSRVISELLFEAFPNCSDVLKNIDQVTQQQTDNFCGRPEYKSWGAESLTYVVLICDEPYGTYWSEIRANTTLTPLQLQQLCDNNAEGFGMTQANIHQRMHDKYNCNASLVKCSNHEIAIMQWFNSSVTLDPPLTSWNKTDTAFEVYPDLFQAPMEYHHFYTWLNYSDGNTPNYNSSLIPPKPNLNKTQVEYLLSYDCLFSATMIIKAFLDDINGDLEDYRKWFLVDEFVQLNHYMRYMMIQIPFGGFAQEKTIDEILFGYDDLLLKQLATMDPAQGGDPSIPYRVGLNPNPDLSQAQPQQMWTGQNNSDMVRRYSSVAGYSYLTVPRPFFDGKNVSLIQVNPWNTESPLNVGTDSFCFKADVQKDDDLHVVVTDLVRSAKLKYVDEEDYHGLKVYRTGLDKEFFQINSTFNNNKYVGLVNFTSVQQAPVFNSFAHFYQADPILETLVEIYKDYDLKDRQYASDYDKSYVVLEPYSGAGVSALLNLQINVEYKVDNLLFPGSGNRTAMLPTLWVYRGANFTGSQVDEFFGDLKTGIKAQSVSRWVGLAIGIFLIVLGLGLYWFKLRKAKNLEADGDYQRVNMA